MIDFIIGTVTSVCATHCIVLVNNIAYRVQLVPSTLIVCQRYRIYLITHEHYLLTGKMFGFLDQTTRDLFSYIIQVPQLGTQTAIAILNKGNITQLINHCQNFNFLFWYHLKVKNLNIKKVISLVFYLHQKYFTPLSKKSIPDISIVNSILKLGYHYTVVLKALQNIFSQKINCTADTLLAMIQENL